MATAHFPALVHMGGQGRRGIDEHGERSERERREGELLALDRIPRRITFSEYPANNPTSFVILPVLTRAQGLLLPCHCGPRDGCPRDATTITRTRKRGQKTNHKMTPPQILLTICGPPPFIFLCVKIPISSALTCPFFRYAE